MCARMLGRLAWRQPESSSSLGVRGMMNIIILCMSPQVFILWMKTDFKGAVPVGFSVTELFEYMGGSKLLLNPKFVDVMRPYFYCIY